MTPAPPRYSFRFLVLTVALATGSVACGSGAADEPAGTTPAANDTGVAPTIDALTIESGYSTGLDALGTRFTSTGAVITNTAATTACGVQVDFSILDGAGAVLDTKSEALHMVAPGEALALSTSGLGGGSPDEPASFTVVIAAVASFDAAGTCAGTSTTAQGITLRATDSRIDTAVEYITGTVHNPSDTTAEQTMIECVLRDAFGAIVGGDSGTVRGTIAPGGDVDFDIRLLWSPVKATSAECSAFA